MPAIHGITLPKWGLSMKQARVVGWLEEGQRAREAGGRASRSRKREDPGGRGRARPKEFSAGDWLRRET